MQPEVTWNLPGTGACDFRIPSVERSTQGCSLHQGASFWNDAPVGAAPGQKTGTQPCKPQYRTVSLDHTQQVQKSGMVITPKDYFRAKTADSLTQLRSGGYG